MTIEGNSPVYRPGVVGVDVRRAEITRLQHPRGHPAVSILMPTHRHHPDNAQDPIRLRNLLARARDRLLAEHSRAQASTVVARLERAANGVDFTQTLDGLAVLASADEHYVLHLPLPVQERVVVDTSFATRDLVRALQRAPRCWVLVLSGRTTRLFEAVGEHFVEIPAGGFPLRNEEDEPLAGDFGQEPSADRLARLHRFCRRVDEGFAVVAVEQPLPLILVGVDRVLSAFDEVTRHRHLVIGRVTGGHESAPAHQVAELVRPVVEDHVSTRRADALAELEKAVSQRRYAAGFTEVSQLVEHGRAEHLLVEEHLDVVDEAGGQAVTSPYWADGLPSGDVVDDLIEAVLATDGRVTFVDDGALADRDGIALILRF